MALCWLFGHSMTRATETLKREMLADAFTCHRCGKAVPWNTMHWRIQDMRGEYRTRLAINAARNPQTDSREG